MRWLWLALVLAGAASAAGPQQRWSAPAPAGRSEDLEAAESEWVPLAAPCPTCRSAAPGGGAGANTANTAALFDDDLGLTPPKAPVVQRQIFSARQPSFFPQDFPSASPSHAPFFPASPSAAPQPKQLFGSQPQQPANHFLQQIGIPDNLQQFILSPPKQDFPLPNVQQVLQQQQSGFGQPLLPFSLAHNAPQPPQRPAPPPPPPPPAALPLPTLSNVTAPQKEEVQLLYVPVETLRQRGQLGQHGQFGQLGPQQTQPQRFAPPPPPQQQQQQQQQLPQASNQFSQAAPGLGAPGPHQPRAQSHVLQYHPQNPNGQFSLSLNHPTNPFPQQQPQQHFQQFPPQPQPPPQQHQFRLQQQQPQYQPQPPPQQHHFQHFPQQFPPPQFQHQHQQPAPPQSPFPQFPSPHRFAVSSTPAPPANHQFSFVQQTPSPQHQPAPTSPAPPTPTAAPAVPAPHQPPLSVYMSPAGHHDTKITDVLQLLKNARTIPVLDNVTPDSPQVFVGPANLQPPKGYAKFELPYLSSLDTNRVERKVNRLPFFVAPLSFQPPAGYSKILLPPPHIGSVVVNANVTSNSPPQVLQQQILQQLPQVHEKDYPITKTSPAPPPVQSTVSFSLPSEITPVNPRLPTLVNSLDEGRPSSVEASPTTPVTPVSLTTPRRQPYLRPATTPLSPATAAPPAPTARSTVRRPLPTRPHPRTTEAAPPSTESYTFTPSVTASPELASASPDQADPSFQSQRVTGANGNAIGTNIKRGRKRLRNQHRLNGVSQQGQQQPLDDAVRSSTEQLNTLTPTTETAPSRFAPENVNLLQQQGSFPTERPVFGSSPFQQTDRPSFGANHFQQTERPSFSSTPFQQTERPSFSSTPFQQTERPSFLNTFQPESGPSSTFPTERPTSFTPSPTPPPAFRQEVTTEGILQPASINGFLQQEQQPQPEEPQDLNQIQFPATAGFQQEFFPTRLEDGKVQYQYNLQPQSQAEADAQPDPQANFEPAFVRVRGRIHPQHQQQQQQQQQSLLPHVPVELQKAVRVNPRPTQQQDTTAFGQDTPVSGPAGANLAVRVRGKIRSRPRHQFQPQQAQPEQAQNEQQPEEAPGQFLKETVIERTTTTTTAAPLLPAVPVSVSYAPDVAVSAHTEAAVTQQQAEQEVAVTQQVSEEPISETTQPSTSTTRAGVRKYSNFVRAGAPRRPGLRVGQPAASSTTTTTTTQRPRGTRRPGTGGVATGAGPAGVGVGVRGRVRTRPTSTTTEATAPASDADAVTPAELYGRRRGPGSRTPPSALSNEVLDSDHQESVPPPRSTVQRFDSRRRGQEDAAAVAAAPAEQPAEDQPAPQTVRVRVRRPGHRRQPAAVAASAPGTDQSHADSKVAFALDNGEVGKDSQYGEKHVDEAVPTAPAPVPALEAHPTFDWSAHAGSSLKNGWSAANGGSARAQPLPAIQYSVSGAPGEVDAKPSEHRDDPSDYLEPTPSRPSRPASLDSISAQDVDNVMKALEEVGLLDQQPEAPAGPSAPEQDILKEDNAHKKAADPTTQKKSGNGRRRGNWVRVRVKRPRDGLATAESQNAGSFPGNSVVAVVAPTSGKDVVFEKSVLVSPPSSSAPSAIAADLVDLPAPTTTGVSFADEDAAITALGDDQDREAPTAATTPRISSLSIAADGGVDEDSPAAAAAAEPSAEPVPSTSDPTATDGPAPSTFAPVTSSSGSDADDLSRASTTTATPSESLLEETTTTPSPTTTAPAAGVSEAGRAPQDQQDQQDQLNKFLGSTTSTKVSMETEICFRGRCIKTKGSKASNKQQQQQQDQVPEE